MKKCLIIALCICLSVFITACSQRGNTKESSTSQSQSVNENPSTQTEQKSHNEVSALPNVEEKSDDIVVQSESSVTPESSAVTSSTDQIQLDPLGLMGDGEIALFASDTGSDKYLELNKAQASEFLAKIDFSQFIPSDLKQEIVPPDAMVGQTGTAGNYIQIGMPHTNLLYIYDKQPQALLVGIENKYYDIPSDIYEQIKSILAEF